MVPRDPEALRIVSIDPGTVSAAIFCLEGSRGSCGYYERPSEELSKDPDEIFRILRDTAPSLVVAPSGYGLPPEDLRRASSEVLSKALLLREGDPGVPGLRYLSHFLRNLHRLEVPVIGIPGVRDLASVPWHRKVHRIDMGTADKLATAILATEVHRRKHGIPLGEASLVVVEMGAFTAGVAVSGGKAVDGVGGSLFPIGLRSRGGVDGEAAVAHGRPWVKADLFRGGVLDLCGRSDPEDLAAACPEIFQRYLEDVAKTVAMLEISLGASDPGSVWVYLSGRGSRIPGVLQGLSRILGARRVVKLEGIFPGVKEPAQGMAIYGNGWAGGFYRDLYVHMISSALSRPSGPPRPSP